MFSTKQKQDLEKKHVVHFPRRTLNENENQITNIKQSNDKLTNTFNEIKNKNKPKELLNVNENCPFGPTSTRET
jgi:hypothetical protein